MSNAFNNFLGGVVNGIFGRGPIMKDYQHADGVYVKNNYARTPKLGFLYFVTFNINIDVVPRNSFWAIEGYKEVGLLAKRAELPKFSVTAETLNQYNRKTVVQSTLKYNPISIDLHDDNSNITRDFWKAYFQYYYADSTYGNPIGRKDTPNEFQNTKYNPESYRYGLNNFQSKPFLKSIDIYVLHQHKFSQYTLINPLITEWNHDTVNQEEGNKILSNKMTVAYETVLYKEGKVTNTEPERFTAVYYDTSPSPLSIAGNGTNSLFGPGGVIAGASELFNSERSIFERAIIGANVARNARSLTKGGLKQEGYSILTGVLGSVQQTGNQPGGIGSSIQNGINQRGLGINIFSGQNTSINGTTQSNPVIINRT